MNIQENINSQMEHLNKVSLVLKLYPDITEHTDRWRNKRYSSASINSIADKCVIKHNCGCCSDSPLEIWPYKEVEGIEVYSKPPYFFIGQKSYYGDTPDPGWENELKKNNIPEIIIQKAKAYFNAYGEREEEDE